MRTARRSHKPKHFRVPTRGLAILVVGALVAGMTGGAESASGSISQGAQAPLPTWRSFYDWAHGNGYVGWHTASSDPTDYGIRSAYGGQYGLWLWAKGGQHIYTQTDDAEWTYTAPGTTRLLNTTLSFSYRNKLLAHHCIEVGYRTLDGVKTADEDFCQPAHPPDSQDLTNVHLADPNPGSPTAKVLFLRIHVDCGGAATCSKTIPTQDPLTNGNYVRFLSVDSTLVDDDLPVANPSGPLYDLHDHFIDGSQSYGVTLDATDAGSGIASSSFTHASTYPPQTDPTVTQNAPCDPTHNTPVLDARICPPEFSWQTTADTRAFPEGPTTFTENATDVGGNVGSASWTIYIDRTPPDSVVPSGSLWDLAGQTTAGSTEFVTVDAHDPGADEQKASGIASVWVEEVGVGLIDSSDNPDCTDLSCPDSYSATLPVELGGLNEGDHTFVVKAQDFVGHVTEGPSWTVTIARDPSDNELTDDEPDVDTGPAGPDETPDGGAVGYDPTTDPDPACDAYVDIGISDWCSNPTLQAMNSISLATTTQATASYSGCGLKAVFWSIGKPPQYLAEALGRYNLGPGCADYYFAQTPTGTDEERQLPVCLQGIRSSWPVNFHSAPVFQWTSWATWVRENYPGNQFLGWYRAGLTFRDRIDSGNNCRPGDKWFLNEMPSDWHTNATERARILDALRGLYQGSSDHPITGFTADPVEPQNQNNDNGALSTYKQRLQTVYAESNFWKTLGKYVDGYAKESYDRCLQVCVPGDSRLTIANQGVIPYTYHQRILAQVAPTTTKYAAVKATMGQDYMPLLNALWNSPLDVYDTGKRQGPNGVIYGLTIRQMAGLIHEQIYAARLAANSSWGSAGRIGFAWHETFGHGNDLAEATQLADNLARALFDAYSPYGGPGFACLDYDGADPYYYGCATASRVNAAFNSTWNIFSRWP
ncbi:MAG TPA: hypothetical protein VJ851_02095 [Jatrophihabitans sp.]|nr:hypothetical protein [Jatrophihabitans sp.]